jgi:hypothetical protein
MHDHLTAPWRDGFGQQQIDFGYLDPKKIFI